MSAGIIKLSVMSDSTQTPASCSLTESSRSYQQPRFSWAQSAIQQGRWLHCTAYALHILSMASNFGLDKRAYRLFHLRPAAAAELAAALPPDAAEEDDAEAPLHKTHTCHSSTSNACSWRSSSAPLQDKGSPTGMHQCCLAILACTAKCGRQWTDSIG